MTLRQCISADAQSIEQCSAAMTKLNVYTCIFFPIHFSTAGYNSLSFVGLVRVGHIDHFVSNLLRGALSTVGELSEFLSW